MQPFFIWSFIAGYSHSAWFAGFSLILPLQLAASMGRAASPIAGVIVAIAGVAGVSSVELARRNTFPLIGGIVFLILYHLITF